MANAEVVRDRNLFLNEHIDVVLCERDDVLYKNQAFTQELTTDVDDSLALRRREHIKQLESDLSEAEQHVLLGKVLQTCPSNITAVEPPAPHSLVVQIFEKCEEFKWSDEGFATTFVLPFELFARHIVAQCKNAQDTLLHATSGDSNLVVDMEEGEGHGGSDSVARKVFFEDNKWSDRKITLALGLILYRLLAGYPKKRASVLAKFRSLFFELSDSMIKFFVNLWFLDSNGPAPPLAMGTRENPEIVKIRDELHTMHLQGTLVPYFSEQQLERVFRITRGPYVSTYAANLPAEEHTHGNPSASIGGGTKT